MIVFNLFDLERMKNIYNYNACAHIYITCAQQDRLEGGKLLSVVDNCS